MFSLGQSENGVSQLRAVQLLQKLGFQYLSPEEVAVERGGDFRFVLLKGVLAAQLKRINRIDSQGEAFVVSDASVVEAIEMVNGAADSESRLSHEKVYRLLLGGGSFEPSVNTDLKRSRFNFIDWHHPLNNAFHVTADFCVRINGGRPDRFFHIVCFINGLPLVAIVCSMKGGSERLDDLKTRFSSHLQVDAFSRLSALCQLFIGLDGEGGGYVVLGPGNEDRVGWDDEGDGTAAINDLINAPPEVADHHKLFFRRDALLKAEFERCPKRNVTGQDRVLWNLCRPRYLIDHVRHLMCFDEEGCVRKFARYSQYRVATQLRDRVDQRGNGRRQRGGLIWYAESAGKSQVLLFLGKSLAFDSGLRGSRILFVSDRSEFLDWIESNFLSSGEKTVRATSWEDIDVLKTEKETKVITMPYAEFEGGLALEKGDRGGGDGMIVLVDKGRGDLCSDSIRRIKSEFPNACFLVFSGSPPTKSEKRLARAFGGYSKSRYTYRDALSDRAIVPLYYDLRSQLIARSERRNFLFREFSSELKGLGTAQDDGQPTAESLESWFLLVACDLSDHYSRMNQGTGSRGVAIVSCEGDGVLLKSFLDRLGKVRSEIAVDLEGRSGCLGSIDSPLDGDDLRERRKGGFETKGEPSDLGMSSEILIVDQKPLPLMVTARDCLLYIVRWPVGSDFLQAISFVNRHCEGKDFALIVDYSSRSVNSEWLPILDRLKVCFDRADLDGSLIDIDSMVASLRDRLDSVWKHLSLNGSEADDERLELLLADAPVRVGFLESFFEFHRVLLLAHSSSRWTVETSNEVVHEYHTALCFFQSLRMRITSRYALNLDHAAFEPSLKKLIAATQNETEIPLVLAPDECLDRDAFDTHLKQMGTVRAKADMIAYQTIRMISEKADGDPFYFREFSDRILQAIEARQSEQLDDVQYLKSVSHLLEVIRQGRRLVQGESRQNSEFISTLAEVSRRTIGANLVDRKGNDEWQFSESSACYAVSHSSHEPWDLWNIHVAAQVLKLIRKHCRAGWRDSVDVQNRMRNDVDDYLFDLQEKGGLKLSISEMDEFIESSLAILKAIEG
jgi:type I restriction enzyme, R subunit